MMGDVTHRFWKFDPANAERLLSEDRHRMHSPELLLGMLNLRPRDIVADIGCGPGFFTVPVAERIRPGGRVVAIDTAPEMLALLRRRLTVSQLTQIAPIHSEESRLPLRTEACDRVLLAFLLHELVDPLAFLAEVRRVLRPSGVGVLADWLPTESPAGPPLDVRVPPDRAAERLRAAGLEPSPHANLGPYSYAIPFRRSR
jgi:ubiquinone/menaquinone biosynthesis C-methylase UbiE